jgi:hypothetical protein
VLGLRPVALNVVRAEDDTTLPVPSVLPVAYVVPSTGLVGVAPVGYLTTRYPSGAPAAAVKVPLICEVENAVRPRLVADW